MNANQRAESWFRDALAACNVERTIERRVRSEQSALWVDEQRFALGSGRTVIIALGKAAVPMAHALMRVVSGIAGGVVASPWLPKDPHPELTYFEGGHPEPNAASLASAKTAVALLNTLTEADNVIFLISGGGSALFELPKDVSISLADLQETNRLLVRSGATIAEINRVRKRISAVKGGGLARSAGRATQISLLISDVPDAMLSTLSSGPTLIEDVSTLREDALAICRRYGLIDRLPQSVVVSLGQQDTTPERPAERTSAVLLLSNHDLLQEIEDRAARDGYAVTTDNSCDDWHFADAGEYLLRRFRILQQQNRRVCLLSGGEVTVAVPANGGKGGRNQHFALWGAQAIQGEEIALLSGASDGVDGNSDAAGAVVDGSSWQVWEAGGLTPAVSLERFDSNSLLASTGNTIQTGPTGNNLRDVRIFLSTEP